MSHSVRIEKVTFGSAGEVLAGDLYTPEPSHDARRPAVVVAGAWATVKEQMAAGYAREMASRGYIALAFDFRSWGRSGGHPRSMEDPQAKSADIVAAAEFLGSHPAVDRHAITGLGICAGSSYMVAAATRTVLIDSLALVAPALPTRADVQDSLGGEEATAALVEVASDALDEFERTGESTLVPAVPPGGGEPGHGGDYYTNPDRGLIREWDNTFNVASWASWIAFDVHSLAPLLTQPLLVVHSDAAVNPDSVRRFVAHVAGPTDQLWLDGVTQFDFYDQPGPMRSASDASAAHYLKS